MSLGVDILFINPGSHKTTYQSLSGEFSAVDTPIWATLLADSLRKKGYKTAIYDVNVECWGDNAANCVIDKYSPKVVVLMVYGNHPSASTQTMPAASLIAHHIKLYNKQIPIAMGGTHPSALPQKTLLEEDIDFVVQGEGLYVLEGLIKYINGENAIRFVGGLWYKKDGQIFHNPACEPIKDLDNELDNYAWDLLPPINNYRAHNWHCFQNFKISRRSDFSDIRSPYISLYTSLGCSYSCSFCCINAVFGKPGIRYWSTTKVASWIDILVTKYNVRNIRFADELFILSPKRVEHFCDLMIERNYNLNIWVYGRVDTIDERLLKKIKKAGINWIALGIESANETIRKNVNKPIKKNIKDIVRLIQKNDINIVGNYMFGFPQDNLSTMNETLELAFDLNCEFANFYAVIAYPGSLLYQDLSSKREWLPSSWNAFSQHSYETRPLSTNYLTSREVLKFRDESFNKYFKNPRYLNYIRGRFGDKVERHIKRMMEIKLKRKLLEENEITLR